MIWRRTTDVSDLKQKTLRGAGWSAGVQVVVQVVRFGLSLALARLLSPSDFGLWGMALVFSGFAGLFGDLGLGAALIQKTEVERRHLDSAFWANVAMGFALTALLFIFAPLLARVYGEPGVSSLLRLASLEFTVNGLVVVSRVLVVREMKFRTIALAELAGTIGAGVLACWMGMRGCGAWSLVALNLGASVISAALLLWAKPWMPRFTLDRAALRELLGFGFFLQAYNLLNYWLRNLDKLLIGRILGGDALGHFTRAFSTMMLPQTQLIGSVHGVLWPALARCAHDPARLREAYQRSLVLVCFICLPCMTGLWAVAHDAVLVLYGSKWLPAVETLRWMCVAGFAQVPLATVGWLYLATGRTQRLLGWGIGGGVVTVAGIFIGVYWGRSIESVAMWQAVTSFVLLPAAYVVAAPVAQVQTLRLARACAPVAAASVAMGALVWLAAEAVPLDAPGLRFAFLAALGAAAYAALCWPTAARHEVFSVVRQLRKRPAPVSAVDAPSAYG